MEAKNEAKKIRKQNEAKRKIGERKEAKRKI
jgi:hypothetical protein